MANPIVFFNVAINGASAGRIVMELYADMCPITAENFRALCTGVKGKGFHGVPLHYKGSSFNYVQHGGFMVGGNILSQEDGIGESIYGANFKNEYSSKRHDKPGTLSMDARVTGKEGQLGSQFIICSHPCSTLDSMYSVFGQVVDGMNVVYAINNIPLSSSGKPTKSVTITESGQIINTKVFFDIEIDYKPKGRIIFELFDDTAPRTAQNFRALCTGEKGYSKKTGKPLHYKGSSFFRVISDKTIHGGDIHVGDGTGMGESIYSPSSFGAENFVKKHAKEGILSMLSSAHDGVIGSQFFITTSATEWLDGKHVVCGQVVSGMDVMNSINQVGSAEGDTTMKVKIADCGQIYH